MKSMRFGRSTSAVALRVAGEHVQRAAQRLSVWREKQTNADDCYVRAGHEAVAAIENAIIELQNARWSLKGEINDDRIEREVRIEEFLTRERNGALDGADREQSA